MKGIHSRCAICGGSVPTRWWVCARCKRESPELAGPFRTWPRWAKELVAQEQRERRWQWRWRHRVMLISIDPHEYDVWSFLTQIMEGDAWLKPRRSRWPPGWIPPFPYESAELNRQYRIAHGLVRDE